MQRASTGEGHGALCVYPSILVRAVWTKAAGTDLVQCPHFERLGAQGCLLAKLLFELPVPTRAAAASEDELHREVLG